MKTLLALAIALSLTACGQTGPLRLPEPKRAPAPLPANTPADVQADQPKPSLAP